jgi:lipopolysaccharide biosynthesis regulator YciM
MRFIAHYFRQVFCKHDFIAEEQICSLTDEWGDKIRSGPKVYMRCKKCGFHTKHWKY